MTTAELARRVAESGARVNAKSLYRLADPEEPLEKVDMRVIAAVCQALEVGIGDVLTFDEPTVIETFGGQKQARMDSLMARHNSAAQSLTADEMTDLSALVDEAEAVARGNARRLASRKRRLQRSAGRRPPQKPDEAGTS